MYFGVPSSSPVVVSDRSVVTRQRSPPPSPASRSAARSPAMSRWITPRSCVWPTASAISRASFAARGNPAACVHRAAHTLHTHRVVQRPVVLPNVRTCAIRGWRGWRRPGLRGGSGRWRRGRRCPRTLRATRRPGLLLRRVTAHAAFAEEGDDFRPKAVRGGTTPAAVGLESGGGGSGITEACYELEDFCPIRFIRRYSFSFHSSRHFLKSFIQEGRAAGWDDESNDFWGMKTNKDEWENSTEHEVQQWRRRQPKDTRRHTPSGPSASASPARRT